MEPELGVQRLRLPDKGQESRTWGTEGGQPGQQTLFSQESKCSGGVI